MRFEIVKVVEVPNSEIIEKIEDAIYEHICDKVEEEMIDYLTHNKDFSHEEAENVVYNMTVNETSKIVQGVLKNILEYC